MPGYLIGRLLGLPSYRDKTTAFVLTAQETLYKAILVLMTVTAILWMSIFLYATFYYSYMPAISHSRPVHLQFTSCGKEQGLCSYPSANVTLTRKQNLLMVGQPYKIVLVLEMPESKANQDAGMFMVCADLKDKEDVIIETSCRAAILPYKSSLHHSISTLVLSPFLLSGSAEEKQIVPVELFSNFEEDRNRPVTEAYVRIQSQHVHLYQTYLKIHAHFTGLRYVMFHWPVLSAVIGITTNLFFLTIIAFLCWYKFFTPKQIVYHVGYDTTKARTLEERRVLAKQRLMKERGQLLQQRTEALPNQETFATTKEDLSSVSDPINEQKQKMYEISNPTKDIGDADPENFGPVIVNDETDESESNGKLEKRRTSDEFEVLSPESEKKCELESSSDLTEEQSTKETKNNNEQVNADEDDKENVPFVQNEEGVRHRGTVATNHNV